jgi:hypothetical protein
MVTQKLPLLLSFFVIIVALALVTQSVVSTILVQKVLAAPTVTISQRCVVVNGVNWFETTLSGSGWPPNPARGVVLIDDTLASEGAFSFTGDLLGFSGSGPGGPDYGPGLHTVFAFHDANGNRQHDPGEVTATTSFTSIVCGANPCTVGHFDGSDAAEMNTVVSNSSSGPKAKTIHVEKEVFNCQAQPRPNTFWPIIVDVSIFTEIIESTPPVPIVKNIEVVKCQKNATTGDILGCKRSVPSTNLPTNSSCSQFADTLPVEMNTVVFSPGIVKTIKAEKEVFFCDTPNVFKKIKDVILFTEVIENLSTGKSKKTSEVVTCLKDVPTAVVIACKATKPRLLP